MLQRRTRTATHTSQSSIQPGFPHFLPTLPKHKADFNFILQYDAEDIPSIFTSRVDTSNLWPQLPSKVSASYKHIIILASDMSQD
jgi:hypothetical protein